MTRFEPTLIVNRLMVVKNGNPVLEIPFHKGLNIIRGHNSSGKTTTLDFIAHTLGAEELPWKKEALLCDYSMLEVSLNGNPVTLRRDVGGGKQAPLYIFWGLLKDAAQAPFSSWELYPFRRSANKLSFTQSILVALGMPEAQGDGASNLTMHQFLRVIYADQPSLHSPIFRIDSFDSALTRETVGSYLSGVYDDRLYSAQLEKRRLEKELSQAESELKSIFAVLAKSQQDVNIELFGQQIGEAERRRDQLLAELDRLKKERTVHKNDKSGGDEGVSRAELNVAKKKLSDSIDLIVRKESELEDSKRFVVELLLRLDKLNESEAAREYFGALAFNFCPCCLGEIKPLPRGSKHCSLCKGPLEDVAGESQILRMRNELRIQLKESEGIIVSLEVEVKRLRSEIPALRQELATLENKYLSAISNWSSEIEFSLERVSREIGAMDQEIRGLYENQKLAGVIKDLQEKRDQLVLKIVECDSLIEKLEFSQDSRKRKVSLEIAQSMSRLLKLDLHRQAEFKTAENVNFSFIDNQVTVDGSAKFSESSTVVLRHLFHLALLTASTKIKEMRFPRFLMLDGIEDGGLELERSYKLQEIIENESSSYEVDYQIIMATSQISPKLDVDKFVVGRAFTEEQRSLAIL